jgi:hypothetical protein
METVLVERHDKMRVNYLMNALTPQLYHSILDARVEAKWLKDTKEKRHTNYILLKKYFNEIVKADYELKMTYKTTELAYGRRYSVGPSLQSIAREIRTFLMPEAIDLDIENCWFNIIHKICINENFECKNLKTYVSGRDSFIKKIYEEETDTTVKENEFAKIKASIKQKIINTLTSSKTQYSDSITFKRFDKEMKNIQNNLINCKKYNFITASDEKNNYNGSFASHVCTYHENLIIQSAEMFMKNNKIDVLGLMFDGLLVSTTDFNLSKLNEYILKETGYPYKFVIKTHKDVFPDFESWIYKEPEKKTKPDEIICNQFLEWAVKNNLARLKNTETILKRMDMNYGKKIYLDTNECINAFIGDTPFIEPFFLCLKAESYRNMLSKFIINGQPNKSFPCVSKNWRYYSFKNGIFDIVKNELIAQLDPDILCNNRFETDFVPVVDMPEELIRIFSHQNWTFETMKFYCGLMGRLFFPINHLDKYGIVTCNMGISSSGKSSILERICDIVDNYKTLNSKGHNFSLEGCDRTNFIYIGEGENLPDMLDIEDFKKMARGEVININIKNKTAYDVVITAPMALVANKPIEYADTSRAIQNRIIYFYHEIPVEDPDGELKIKMESMNHIFLIYFTHMYHKLLSNSTTKVPVNSQISEWSGDVFEKQNDFLCWLNMLNEDLYYQVKPIEGAVTKAKELNDAWKSHWKFGLGKTAPAPRVGASQRAELQRFGIYKKVIDHCRYCEQLHKKGCCDKYQHNHKKGLEFYVNCELVRGARHKNSSREIDDPE